MSKISGVNIVCLSIAGRFSHFKIFHKSEDFNILSKMTPGLEISFFEENKKLYKMFEDNNIFFLLNVMTKM